MHWYSSLPGQARTRCSCSGRSRRLNVLFFPVSVSSPASYIRIWVFLHESRPTLICCSWPACEPIGRTSAPAAAVLVACAALHVDRLADPDPGRCAVVASAVPARPGDRLIERRAFALVQLPALLRQLLQLARARLTAARQHRRWPSWWPSARHVDQLASLDIGRCAFGEGSPSDGSSCDFLKLMRRFWILMRRRN